MTVVFIKHIAHIEMCEKKRASRWLYYGTNKVKVGKQFFGLVPMYETKTGVFEHYFMDEDKFVGTVEDFNNKNKNIYCDGEDVYQRPHIVMTMNNNNTIKQYFSTVDEMRNFVHALKTQDTITLP